MRGINPGFIAIGVLLLAGLLIWYHEWFIAECMASNNTKAFCEMLFWKK